MQLGNGLQPLDSDGPRVETVIHGNVTCSVLNRWVRKREVLICIEEIVRCASNK